MNTAAPIIVLLLLVGAMYVALVATINPLFRRRLRLHAARFAAARPRMPRPPQRERYVPTHRAG